MAARESLLNFAAKLAMPINAPPVIWEVSVYLKSARAGTQTRGSKSSIDSDLRARFMGWVSCDSPGLFLVSAGGWGLAELLVDIMLDAAVAGKGENAVEVVVRIAY
jgi:hypothetical protein